MPCCDTRSASKTAMVNLPVRAEMLGAMSTFASELVCERRADAVNVATDWIAGAVAATCGSNTACLHEPSHGQVQPLI
jgi:hypothetical protein